MYRAIIIGCGSIGALKDDRFDSPITENVFTTAHAFHLNKDIEMAAMIDSDISKAVKAAKKWNVPAAYHSIDSIPLSAYPIDIAVVSVPTEHHVEVMRSVLRTIRPKIVMLEKPAGMSLLEAEEIERLIDMHGHMTIVGVNYSRRYNRTIREAREKISQINTIYNAVFYYTRGLLRDGCHAIDMLHYFFGDCISANKIDGLTLHDYSEHDPTITGHLKFDRCKNVLLLPVDGREASMFELHIMTDEGMIIFSDNFSLLCGRGLSQSQYGSYQQLSPKLMMRKISLENVLCDYASEAVDVLNGKRLDFSCTLRDAIQVHRTIEMLKK